MMVRKESVSERLDVDGRLVRLVCAYIAAGTAWLLFGSLVGEYLGITFLWPGLNEIQWLSFGRLRPVHTNTVFWGWSSMGMLGIAHYVVPRTCQTRLYSYRLGWAGLVCINLAVIAGDLHLMAGMNNGAQEYREYIWPVMGLFGVGLVLCGINFYRTIRRRETAAIYISNWYILSAVIWTLTLVTVAYLPGYQSGISQTIVQGYYMHQGVGMWFTPMVLGLTYYMLPKLLNRPIYSYALGILAFWTQLFFYSMIGSHHFVFAPIPWWMQTVAIIFSVGMIVPVVAGTANFVLTMRGSWSQVKRSYSLPFVAVGIAYYCIGSLQGTAEALRSANLYWHFTNFTVGHSHITMYGFVGFLIWGAIYGLLPRLTGREPPQSLVGIHFWLAFVGLGLYGVSLSIGGTIQGITWMSDASFMASVRRMVPYWAWRGVAGTLMFAAHIVFAYNLWRMWPEASVFAEVGDEPAEVEDV
jgi:cytochrome c oxidase cbb3-type subunit 1